MRRRSRPPETGRTRSSPGAGRTQGSPLLGRIEGWLYDRLALSPVVEWGGHKTVPLHRLTGWYYLGGIALFLFLLQVVTGVLLMLYYSPTAQDAHVSVQSIRSQIEFGWLMRTVHVWAAHVFIIVSFVHMMSAYFMRAHRPPREMTWLTGVVLMALLLGFGFSGYLLPWDTLAFFATKVGIGITESTPLVGPWVANLLRGGPAVSDVTLHRFFTIHVMVLPILFTAVLGVHLYLVQAHGTSAPPWYCRRPPEEQPRMRFFPDFLYSDLVVWLLVFDVIVVLAALFPAVLGPVAEPFAATPAGIRPEWYFLASYQLLRMMPSTVLGISGELIGMGIFGALVAVLALVPFWDRGGPRLDRVVIWYGVLFITAMVILTVVGYVVPTE